MSMIEAMTVYTTQFFRNTRQVSDAPARTVSMLDVLLSATGGEPEWFKRPDSAIMDGPRSSIFCSRRFKIYLLLFITLFFLQPNALFAAVLGRASGTRQPPRFSAAANPAMNSARVRNMLQRAKNAQMSGNLQEAQRLWMQVHSLDPSLAKPAWVDQLPAQKESISGTTAAKALLQKADTLAYKQAKPLLEDWLRRHPMDTAIRSYYLMRAEAAGDLPQTRRHQTVLNIEPQANGTPWWKFLLAGGLGVLLSWQAGEFYRDWKTKQQR